MSAALIGALPIAGCGGASPPASRSASTASASKGLASGAASTTSAGTTTAAGPTAATICSGGLRAAVVRALGVPASAGRGSIANSSYPQCAMRARVGGRGVRLTVEVDTEPSPYAVLERTIEEQSQIFPTRTHPAPVHVGHLGLDASWFPEEQQLQTTDGVRLIIVTIGWRGAPTGQKVALARAAAKVYLGRSRPKLARGPSP